MASRGKSEDARDRAARLQWDIDPTPEPNASGRVRNVRLRYRNQRAAASAAEPPAPIRPTSDEPEEDAGATRRSEL